MNWVDFENDLYEALKAKVTSTEEPAASRITELTTLAEEITELYHNTAISAVESGQRSILNKAALEPGKAAIQSAIVGSLSLMYNLNLKASIATLMPIGLATVAYWTPAISPGIINPAPPPPPLVPSPGSTLVFPGNPVLVAQGFKKAYTSYENETDFNVSLRKSAGDIRTGFENHMNSLAGLYTGTSPVPAPVVIPWNGLKPV